MRAALLVALGGAIGSVLRWLVHTWAFRLWPHATFPWGTFAVNVVGCFVIGAVLTLALDHRVVPTDLRLFLATGVLGGFTTFSSFAWESAELAREGQWPIALLYVTGSVVSGLVAAVAGSALAARF